MRRNNLQVRRRNGYIVDVTNPSGKGTAYIVQSGDYIQGFTGVDPTFKKTIARGKTEESIIRNLVKKGKKKIIFAS